MKMTHSSRSRRRSLPSPRIPLQYPLFIQIFTNISLPPLSDLLTTLHTTRPLFSSYLRIRSLASPSSPELAQARSELNQSLQDLTIDLQELIDSVRAVEQDPFRYGLDVGEVGRRRRLVEEVGGEIEDMREELARTVASVGSQAQSRGGTATDALPPPSAFDPMSPTDDNENEDSYAAFEQQRQVEIMHEQDEALDGVFQTVGNLRQQADVMGRELEEQVEMLDEVEGLTDRVGGKLQGGMKRLTTIVRKNEGMLMEEIYIGSRGLGIGLTLDRYDVKLLHRATYLCADIITYSCDCSLGKEQLRSRGYHSHSLVLAYLPQNLYESFRITSEGL